VLLHIRANIKKSFSEVYKILWPRNSSDVNAIEPTWFQIKKETIRKGLITSNIKLKKAWIKC
jgi:hypothetical protein